MSLLDVPTRPTYVLSARALVQHRRGACLAIDSRAIGSVFATLDGPMATERKALDSAHKPGRRASAISVVSVIGPLSQRSETFCGWIDGYDSIATRVSDELDDPEIAGMVLRLDSPGGDVAGLEDCVRRICEARDRTGKPLAVYVDEYAASAAYWLAAGVQNAGVYAPRSAAVGSVGVYTILADETKALEQEGLSIQLVRDPPGKDAANPADPVPDVALARAQAEVAAHAARFYNAVAVARGMNAAEVRALNAATMLAEPALAAGLIDGISNLAEVEALVAAKAAEQARASSANRMAELRATWAAATKKTPATARATTGRASARSTGVTKMTTKIKAAEDMPAPEETPSNGGRATAAEVSASCTECSTSCTDCATACEAGTADEAISAATACMAACEGNIAVLQSFLGMSTSEYAPAPEPVPEDVPAAMTLILSETAQAKPHDAVAEIKRWKASHLKLEAEQAKLSAAHAVLESKERRQLVGALVLLGAELPATAWADQAGTEPVKRLADEPIAELRARVATLTAAKPAVQSDPKPAQATPESEEEPVPERIVAGWKSKGLDGDALNAAIADYRKTRAQIRARSVPRRPAQGE